MGGRTGHARRCWELRRRDPAPLAAAPDRTARTGADGPPRRGSSPGRDRCCPHPARTRCGTRQRCGDPGSAQQPRHPRRPVRGRHSSAVRQPRLGRARTAARRPAADPAGHLDRGAVYRCCERRARPGALRPRQPAAHRHRVGVGAGGAVPAEPAEDPHRGRYFKPQRLHADKAYDRADLRRWLRWKRIGVRIARKASNPASD